MRIRWEDFGDSQTEALQQVYDLPILAKRVEVKINDYTTADTFEAEIDYKNFPFDPRCIRACGVTVAMENVGRNFQDSNAPRVIRPRAATVDSNGNEVPGNITFMGFADDESITFNDSSRSVKLEGRDFTALLIDRKYLKGAVNLQDPVDVVVKSILADLEETQMLQLDNRVGSALPVLAKFWGEQDLLAGKRSVKKDESYWDVIQDIVQRAGLVAYVELDKVVLSKPRVLYSKNQTKRFVYGKNLSSLDFKRKIGRRKNFNVVVRSMNLNTKEVMEAKIPAEATAAWSAASGITNLEVKLPKIKADGTNGKGTTAQGIKEEDEVAPYIAFRIADVADKDHLIEIGQEIYEEMGRQEIEGTLETKEMVTADSMKQPFDLLQLRNGTAISIEMDQGDLKGLSRITTTAERKKFLIARGYNSKIAEVFAETLGKFATPFYTKAVSFTLDESQGFTCQLDFVNFIETTNKALAK